MDNQDQNNNKNTKSSVGTMVALGAVAVLLVGGFLMFSKNSEKNEMVEEKNQPVTTAREQKKIGSHYKDGTYTVEGDYIVHVGQKHIGVTVTLKDGVITDSNVTNEADDPMSVRMQNMFIGGYKELVIGKKIEDVHLTKVSGSSLTPSGFNDALQKIMDQAKS